MAANTLAITPRIPKFGKGKITAAQTDQTGATAANIVTALTALAAAAPPSDGQGALVQDVTVRVPVTSALAVVCIFKKTAAGVRYLIKTVPVTVVAVSATVPGFDSGKIALNEFLEPGDSIDVSSTIAQETHCTFNYGEF